MEPDRPPDRRLSDRPVISAARPNDLPTILALLASHRLPEAGLADHIPTTLVARDGDQVVGCAAIEPYDGAGLLRSVAVAEQHRGTGLGGRLTEAAIALARARGLRALYLLTETAAGFFPRFGFRPIPRTEVAAVVQQSIEFTRACPASALAMVKDL